MHDHSEEHHVVSYRKNTFVLAGLLILTVVTILAAQFDFGYLNVVVAMSIATTKAALVVLFFMHLKYEKPVFRIMVFTCFVILAIAIGFTFFDVAYR